MPSPVAAQTEVLTGLIKENPTFGRYKLIELTGFSRHRVEKFLREYKAAKPRGDDAHPVRSVPVSQFVGRYDYAGMIRATLNRLCRRAFIPDSTMRIESGVPAMAYRAVADLPEFRECQVKSHDGIWWSTESNAAQVRKETQKWGIRR